MFNATDDHNFINLRCFGHLEKVLSMPNNKLNLTKQFHSKNIALLLCCPVMAVASAQVDCLLAGCADANAKAIWLVVGWILKITHFDCNKNPLCFLYYQVPGTTLWSSVQFICCGTIYLLSGRSLGVLQQPHLSGGQDLPLPTFGRAS